MRDDISHQGEEEELPCSIEALRSAGWDERAIYQATALVAFFNFSGRMEAVSGLPMDQFPRDAAYPEATPES